ncbi:MAG: hypothetical protein LC667_12020 [Thioalkalivibrio sp.]|nr:hypothetical protein [Thioalkalivibrio sp.]
MNARLYRSAVLAAFLLAPLAFSQNEARVIEVPGAPLEIISYSAQYDEGGSYSTEGIQQRVVVQNVSDQGVVALGIGFHAFDAFKRYMGRPLTGIAIFELRSEGESTRMSWNHRPTSAFTFEDYGIGVAFVRIVRLEDGTIWEADMDYVLGELQKIEDGLALEDIQEEND